MNTRTFIRVEAQLQRKSLNLPIYVVIPGRTVRPWRLTGTTVIEGSANGYQFGRRTIKAWGQGSDDWFMEFTAQFCKTAGLDVADLVVLELQLADTSMPVELEGLLAKNKSLTAAWLALSETQRRDAGEYIRAGKAHDTRKRRAASIMQRLVERT
jgi:hypothetical protein